MSKQKTAMQRLIDYMRANFHLTESAEMEFTDSLEAEKEQIINVFKEAQAQYVMGYKTRAEQFYSNTFDNSVVS